MWGAAFCGILYLNAGHLTACLITILQGKVMRFRAIAIILMICAVILLTGYGLSQTAFKSEAAAAGPVEPAPVKPAITAQATSAAEVAAREGQPVAGLLSVFKDKWFGYQLNYQPNWQVSQPSANVVIFQAPDGLTQVKVEAVGPLPADGLRPFVDRSLGKDTVMSRQTLTFDGYPAERVVTISAASGSQTTTFYLNAGASAFVISGSGDHQAVETTARSFSAVEFAALK